MAKEFANAFYKTKTWQHTRDAYMKSMEGICELCWANGIIKAGEIVHHRIPLTPENITDPNIALGWNNLQLVCRECHAHIHDNKQRRYKLDELGRVIFK